MQGLRIFIGALGAIMLALIVWAWNAGHFLREVEVLLALPWGVATLVDLYVSFTLIAVVILMVERSLLRAALWIAPIPFLGSLWAAVWFVVRLPAIVERLRARPDPG